MTRRGEIAYKI